ncbi:TIGR03767 family metallophosphoesterase [Streptomyces sp. TS71-3]|uniref:TIGR03767 family metallophosphoesterase n=1 Tax=Streptomyces sp. TS71-3 TaxID=2733862 RepID=UPI001B19956D|nr:TIGR03767 family metallophosphoesterase [Streptomyces sp. TS71-3]GHJ37587.1 metallophosphoesterase [Streptomyces sp. TS71-3]
MPRLRSVATTATTAARNVDRRTLLAAAGGLSLSAGIGCAVGLGGSGTAGAATPTAPGAAEEVLHSRKAPAAPLAPYRAGTTLDTVASASGPGYRRLSSGPGWERVTRAELAAPGSGRAERRTALAAFVQFTDLHLQDVQHPLRLEFLRRQVLNAWRPHEALTVAGAVSLVERINALRGAPVTGAPLRFVVTTGDNTDNNARSELDWFMKTMSGGLITPNTGDPNRYEGVQDSGLALYWQPQDAALRDTDKQLGFPALPGYLDAAIRTLRSPGLNLPWYSTVGNHDGLVLGCYGTGESYLADFAVGDRKLFSLPGAETKAIYDGIHKDTDPVGSLIAQLLRSERRRMRTVTPDPSRAPFTPAEYLKAHLDPAHEGPGPVGHGYTADNLAAGTQYYTFQIADDVLGISLDTINPGGGYEGSIGDEQLAWLKRTLKEHRDGYVLVFSHHTSTTMDNLRTDPARPGDARHGGDELVEVLGSHPRVLAWINGHTHRNEIKPRGTFWEVTTASHVDYPQLARVFELVDNHDGTLSLHTTLVESAAPHRTDFSDLSQTGLAALYRELSANQPGARSDLGGASGDRNTELVLRA